MKLPDNTIQITMTVDQDDDLLEVSLNESLSSSMSDEQETFYLDLCNGLMAKLNTTLEEFVITGRLLRRISMLEDELYEDRDGLEVTFEPSEELLDAMRLSSDDNVLAFKKKLH
mgnify:CR=1 FL=1|jgi:hypothetical protein